MGRRRTRLGWMAVGLALGAPASAVTSTAPSPAVTFGTWGTKQVSLQACNGSSCVTLVQQVVVLDPRPSGALASAQPATVFEGDVVQLSGSGVGQPPLSYAWRVLDSLGAPVAGLAGQAATWYTAGVAPGVYAVLLDVGNLWLPPTIATSSPLLITVEPWPGLFRDGFEIGIGHWSGGATEP